jgi:hypothetical protein
VSRLRPGTLRSEPTLAVSGIDVPYLCAHDCMHSSKEITCDFRVGTLIRA